MSCENRFVKGLRFLKYFIFDEIDNVFKPKVDGTTITINANNELTVIGGSGGGTPTTGTVTAADILAIMPDASVLTKGLMTNVNQTIAGEKTFGSNVTAPGFIVLSGTTTVNLLNEINSLKARVTALGG